MTLGDLFKTVSQLNRINKTLGLDIKYGIKVSTLHTYERLDCWLDIFTNSKDFVKATEEESYFTNILDSEISLMEQAYQITDLEYVSKLTGANSLGEKLEQDILVYIVEVR